MSRNISHLEKFKNYLKMVLTSVAVATSAFIQSDYALIPERRNISILITTILLLFCVEFFLGIISLMISRVRLLRKWILGSEFLEGIWIDKAKTHYAIISIVYYNGIYSVLGEVFDINGQFFGNWNSEFSYFEKGIFKYFYKSNYGSTVENNMGFSEYTFNNSEGKKIPNYFSGYYIDIKNLSSKTRISGKKLDIQITKKLTNLDSKSEWIKELN